MSDISSVASQTCEGVLQGEESTIMARELTIIVGRALALFLGLFSLLNLAGDLATPGFDANLWWIDLRPLSAWVGRSVLAVSAALLATFGVLRKPRRVFRNTTLAVTGGLLIAALWNVAHFYLLLARGTLYRGFPLPFSIFVGIALMVVLAALAASPSERRTVVGRKWRWSVGVMTWFVCLAGTPLAQMVCFGRTDYRRPADAVVVFGAKAFASGNPSAPLEERVRTACDLYHAGLAPLLVFSGGPGTGKVHETESMRRLALQLGVPSEAILLDRDGVNTQATVAYTVQLFDRMHLRRILAVSHFYHLSRVKLAYRRAGREVYTVPAQSLYWLPGLPRYLLREVAAQWAYYLRPLACLSSDLPHAGAVGRPQVRRCPAPDTMAAISMTSFLPACVNGNVHGYTTCRICGCRCLVVCRQFEGPAIAEYPASDGRGGFGHADACRDRPVPGVRAGGFG